VWHWATFQCRSKGQYAALSGQLSPLLHNSLSKQNVTPTRYIATSLCPTFINVHRNTKQPTVARGITAQQRVQKQWNSLTLRVHYFLPFHAVSALSSSRPSCHRPKTMLAGLITFLHANMYNKKSCLQHPKM
jgi:hypothetical protein